MKEILQKRVVPVSTITIVCFSILAVFQLFVIFGGLQIRASSVKRVAPWAYEPFLRLVGEHPDSRPAWSKAGRDVEEKKGGSALADIAGFDSDLELGADAPSLESTQPLTEPAAVIPVSTPTNEPEAKPVDEDVPVG